MRLSLLLIFLFLHVPRNSGSALFDSNCDQNCTFDSEHINSESLKLFPSNCVFVCSHLTIDQSSDVTEKQLTEVFKNVKALYGSLRVTRTSFSSLKFLGRLEKLECENDDIIYMEANENLVEIGMTNFSSTSCNIQIFSCKKLGRLNLPNLKNFYTLTNSSEGSIQKIFVTNADNLCVTIPEMTNFISSDFYDVHSMVGSYCNHSENVVDGEKICRIFNLSSFDPSCLRVIGNVLIGPEEEPFVYKLTNVTWIYGLLMFRETNLVKIDFMEKLEYVAVMDGLRLYNFPGIVIEENANLAEVAFPKLKRARPGMTIQRNSEKFSLDSTTCSKVTNGYEKSEWKLTELNHKLCESVYQEGAQNDGHKALRLVQSAFFIIAMLFSIILQY